MSLIWGSWWGGHCTRWGWKVSLALKTDLWCWKPWNCEPTHKTPNWVSRLFHIIQSASQFQATIKTKHNSPLWETKCISTVCNRLLSLTLRDKCRLRVFDVGLGGLGVPCSLRDPRFAGSNPAEVDGLFQDVKILKTSPPVGTFSRRSRVWDFRLVKEPQAWKIGLWE